MYLNCKSWFSLHYGTYKTEELVSAGKDNGATIMALTNINSTSDVWDFVDFCEKQEIRPVAGTEIRNGDVFCYILLARNNAGFLEINRFLSLHLQAGTSFPDEPGLNEHVYVIYSFGSKQPADLKAGEFTGIQIHEINKLFRVKVSDYPRKFVVLHPITFQDRARYDLHRLLRCIHKNIVLTKLQSFEAAGRHELFISAESITQAFSQYPDIISTTLEVLNNCSIHIDYGTDKTKKLFSASERDDKIFLEKLALAGLKNRYGTNNKEATSRVRKELSIIDDLNFNAYFLITWEILRYARSRGYYFVGRGSGANSITAYCLGITEVDPIELDLYFERFLNPYRASPPDFDIDFSWMDRDEMTDYIFKRFGADHVALLGSYQTFQDRAVIRELGKVFGLPKSEIDALEHPSARFKDDKIQKRILFYGRLLKDFPNHLSVHAGGILISELPIHSYTATELPPKGFITTQIDMFVAEKIGLYKLDILSQRGLGHIKDTVEIVRKNKGVIIDIQDVATFKKDPQVAAKIRAADTIGCFYIESPGMRQLLQKLRCDNYLSLIIASSVIRPGVASSGMMKQYIYYFHHPDEVVYLHPKLEELLPDTKGIMIFQEDVIRVVHFVGRLDLGKADVVRKGMSGKYRGGIHFDQLRDEFFQNCAQDGMQENVYKELWRLIESFKGYSFSKAHSASYAVESYQSLYLKTYHPSEFMVAVINNFGGFYSRELYFHELGRTGVKRFPPCVNEGEYLTSISGDIVYVGFNLVKGLNEKVIRQILQEREDRGKFTSLQELIERTQVPAEQLNLLIMVGACRFTGRNKKELLWEGNFLQNKSERFSKMGVSLFLETPVVFKLPALEQTSLEDAYNEIELLGFPLCNVWDMIDQDTSRFITAKELISKIGQEVITIGYYVAAKQVTTIKRETMYFGTFLDKEGNWLDTVHFPNSFKWSPFQGAGFYAMKGKVVEEFGIYSVEVSQSYKVGIRPLE